MVLSNGDIIQIIVAIIMLVTVIVTSYYSYKSNKYTKEEKKSQLCVDLMNEERQVFLQLKSKELDVAEQDDLLFSFFEQVSLLFLLDRIDNKLFMDYFKEKIITVYYRLINSSNFDYPEDRLKYYPNFCVLVNSLGFDLTGDIITLMREYEKEYKKIEKN
jgi:hypothetical protein